MGLGAGKQNRHATSDHPRNLKGSNSFCKEHKKSGEEMKKIAIIRAELAKDINGSSKAIATIANSQRQYVNKIRRKIKAELISSRKPAPSKKQFFPKSLHETRVRRERVGIASLTYRPDVHELQKSVFTPKEVQYLLIGVAIVAIILIAVYLVNQ